MTSKLPAVIIAALLVSMAMFEAPAQAQSPPTDLTELNIEEILALHIIGRSGEETEDPRRWSIGYRYVYVQFDGNRDGTDDLSVEDVIFRPGTEDRTVDNFPVVPLKICQKAHLFDVTYDMANQWSLSLLLPFVRQETDHVSIVPNFDQFIISSEGIGDIGVSASRPVWKAESYQVMANVGLSLPTGSIDEKGRTPRDAAMDTQLPFTMQIGSGTFDLAPSLSFVGAESRLSWGGELRAKIRLGENDRDYRLGNRFSIAGWLKTKPRPWLEPSVKLGFHTWGRIHGEDKELKVPVPPEFPFPAAVTDPSKFGGDKLVATLGVSFSAPDDHMLEHQSLQLDWGGPVYQSLNGPQPKEVWRFRGGWKGRF